jgi:hypothetical protein
MTPIYMWQTAKKVMLSESCSEVSVLLRRGVWAWIKKSIKIRLMLSTFLVYLGLMRFILIQRTEYPFVNHVKYLGVIFDKRITSRLHREMTEDKNFRTFIRNYPYSKSERWNTKIKLTLHEAHITSGDDMLVPPANLWQTRTSSNCRAYKTRFSAPLEIFQGAHRSAIYTRLSTFRMYTIIKQNCAGNKQKSYKIFRLSLFAALDKAKPDTERIKRLNLTAVKLTTAQVTKLPF